MSLSRLMLRALACVALQKQADDLVSPTMADDRVFDTRLDPLVFRDFVDEDGNYRPMPGIAVYTDDDNGDIINRGTGGPFRRWIDLRVEIVIGSFDTEVIDNETFASINFPMTDAQLEAQLDLFEAQVRWALLALPNRVYTNAFLEYIKGVENVVSHASRDESGNNRFASRRLHFKCEVNDDCSPYAMGLPAGAPSPVKIPFCDDLEKFPAPWIRPMLQAMCAQPSMQNVLTVLSGNKNPATFVPLLKRIGINVDAIEPEADPNLLAAQGKTRGPDGRIEVQNILEIP